jgi:antitoxin FitA
MAQLIVRNIEETVVRKLRQKAARNGVSMEEEHRRILRKTLLEKSPARKKPKMSFLDFLCTMPNVGNDADFARPKAKMREIDLS